MKEKVEIFDEFYLHIYGSKGFNKINWLKYISKLQLTKKNTFKKLKTQTLYYDKNTCNTKYIKYI